ncbi:XdhC family protein [Peribacillus sp. SCS-155]|uniref:XdhC family protein n=1 Tax=Peribacillus sedimenti TaxID=3115297 RepID=UPI00390649C4
MIAINQELQRCKCKGYRGVIGTIISTEGSTYQKAGAKCFISEDGHLTGLVSGGCVEGDLKEYVHEIIATGLPRIVHYDFKDDGDIVWGLGLGCNGKMNIFLEPYRPGQNPENTAMIDAFFSSMLTKPLHRITIVDSNDTSILGKTWLVDPASKEYPKIPNNEILQDYMVNRHTKKNGLSYIGGNLNLSIFYEFTTPPPNLIIFGAGPDAIPLVRMAKTLNWPITVLDYRTALASKQNFPDADEIIVYPAGNVPEITINQNSYVILMTHNFMQDQIILEYLLRTDPAYLGVLGPRKRTEELINSSDIDSDHPKLSTIHSPVGLDLGSKTPEEIALSILAEIMVTYRGGTGSRLSEVKGELIFPHHKASPESYMEKDMTPNIDRKSDFQQLLREEVY